MKRGSAETGGAGTSEDSLDGLADSDASVRIVEAPVVSRAKRQRRRRLAGAVATAPSVVFQYLEARRVWVAVHTTVQVEDSRCAPNKCVPGAPVRLRQESPDEEVFHPLAAGWCLDLVFRCLDSHDTWRFARSTHSVWVLFRDMPVSCVLRGFDLAMRHGHPLDEQANLQLCCPMNAPRLAMLGTVFKHRVRGAVETDVVAPGFACTECVPTPVALNNRVLFFTAPRFGDDRPAAARDSVDYGTLWLLLPPGMAKLNADAKKVDKATRSFFMQSVAATPENRFLPALAASMQIPHTVKVHSDSSWHIFMLRGMRPDVLVPVLWTVPGLMKLQAVVASVGVHTKDMERLGRKVWDVWNYCRGVDVRVDVPEAPGVLYTARREAYFGELIAELVRDGWLTPVWLRFTAQTLSSLPRQVLATKQATERAREDALRAKHAAKEQRAAQKAQLDDNRAALFTALRHTLVRAGIHVVTEHPREVHPSKYPLHIHGHLLRYFDTKVPVKDPYKESFRLNRRLALFNACRTQARWALASMARDMDEKFSELEHLFPARVEEFYSPANLVCLKEEFEARAGTFLRGLVADKPRAGPGGGGGGGGGRAPAPPVASDGGGSSFAASMEPLQGPVLEEYPFWFDNDFSDLDTQPSDFE